MGSLFAPDRHMVVLAGTLVEYKTAPSGMRLFYRSKYTDPFGASGYIFYWK